MRRSFVLILLSACDPSPKVCDTAELCAEQCEPMPVTLRQAYVADENGPTDQPFVLTEAEWAAFGGVVEDLRAGVRPAFDGAIGLAMGVNGERRLNADVEEVPVGHWRVRADLRLPAGVETPYSGNFLYKCTIDLGAERNHARDVEHDNKPVTVKRPAVGDGTVVLDGLLAVDSPDPKGRRACAWRLTFTGGAGERTFEGRFEVPAASELGHHGEGDRAPVAPTDATPPAPPEAPPVEPAPATPTAPPPPTP